MGDALCGPRTTRGEEDRGRDLRLALLRAKARGVEEGGELVAPTAIHAGRLLVARRQGLGVAVGDRPEPKRGGALAGGDVLGPLDVGEQDARVAHIQRVVDLPVRVAVVERSRDEPRLEAGEVVNDKV